MSVIENHISSNLCNELLAKVVKKHVPPKYRLVPIVHSNTIKNCSTILQAFSSRSLSLSSFVSFIFFHKGKDTSEVPQPSVYHLAYVFPIFFCFHKYFINK